LVGASVSQNSSSGGRVRSRACVKLVARKTNEDAFANPLRMRHSVVTLLAEHRVRATVGSPLTESYRRRRIRRRVTGVQVPGLRLVHDGRQLVGRQRADLHTPTEVPRHGTESHQRPGHLVEQVGAHHRCLVDDQGVQRAEIFANRPGVPAGADVVETGRREKLNSRWMV